MAHSAAGRDGFFPPIFLAGVPLSLALALLDSGDRRAGAEHARALAGGSAPAAAGQLGLNGRAASDATV